MENLIKLNNQTAGRDKIARLFQYLSRLLWHRLQKSGKDGVSGLKNLEYQLSTFRKLLRFGRCIDMFYSTLPVFHTKDQNVRYAVVLSKICNALFLLIDHLLWLGRSDLCNVDTEKWSKISNKYWLYSLTLNLMRDVYEIIKILKHEQNEIIPTQGINNLNDYVQMARNTGICLVKNKGVFVDIVKNGCDFFIPMTALGHTTLSPTSIGLLGVISSIAGLAVLIEPMLKLSP